MSSSPWRVGHACCAAQRKAVRAERRTACLTIAAVGSATPGNSAEPEMVASERGNFLMAGMRLPLRGWPCESAATRIDLAQPPDAASARRRDRAASKKREETKEAACHLGSRSPAQPRFGGDRGL